MIPHARMRRSVSFLGNQFGSGIRFRHYTTYGGWLCSGITDSTKCCASISSMNAVYL
jgi:hypothetical protein